MKKDEIIIILPNKSVLALKSIALSYLQDQLEMFLFFFRLKEIFKHIVLSLHQHCVIANIGYIIDICHLKQEFTTAPLTIRNPVETVSVSPVGQISR